MTISTKAKTFAGIALAAAALVGLSSCADPVASTEASSSSVDTEAEVPMPEFSQELHDALPQEILDAGEIRMAAIPLPPYVYKDSDGSTDIGLSVDTAAALEELLGIDIDLQIAPAISDVFTGFTSDKYDVSIAALSNIPSTQENYDFANWVAEFVVFLQTKEGAENDPVDSLESACGHTIATLQGGTAEQVLNDAQANCGDSPIDIALYKDQDSAVLAVSSGRADAAFSSQIPLTYYVEQDPDFVLSGANSTDNGFPPFWVGAFAPKGEPIVPVMLDSFNALKDAGTYDALLAKYGIEANAMDEFGMNMAQE